MAPPVPPQGARSSDEAADPVAGEATSILPRFEDPKRWVQIKGKWVRLTQDEHIKRKARLQRKKHRPARAITARERENMAILQAAGLKKAQVARALRLSTSVVEAHSARSDVQELINKWRFQFRAQALEQAQRIQLGVWQRAEDSLIDGDAKSFDAYTRGLHAIEKVAASASGENKPVGTNIAVINQATMLPEEREELLNAFRRAIRDEERKSISGQADNDG